VLAVAILCAHAVMRHGEEAQTIRRCMDNPGPFQIWMERDGCTTHNLVKLPDGRTGDKIQVKGEDGLQYEVTDYVPKCGILCKIENWLNDTKRAKRIWRAN
jgi:hypothetical protein